MELLGFCLFLVWMLFVIAVGVAFLVWGWKRGEFRIATSRADPQPRNRDTDAAGQGTSINCSGNVIAIKT